jgi:hypothetical protein
MGEGQATVKAKEPPKPPHPIGAWQGVSFDKKLRGSERSDSEEQVLLVLAQDKTFWLATQAYLEVDVEEGSWHLVSATLRLSIDRTTHHYERRMEAVDDPTKRKFRAHAARRKTGGEPTEWSLEERDLDEGEVRRMELAAIELETAVALRERWIKRARAGEPQVIEAPRVEAPKVEHVAAKTAGTLPTVDPAVLGTSLYTPGTGSCSQSYDLFEGVCVHDRLRTEPNLGTLVANYKAGAAPPPLP